MCLNEAYNIVFTGKHFSDSFPIERGLKQEDALSPMLFTFILKYVIRKPHISQVGLKFLLPFSLESSILV
jgi:hypothetical protein